jgi:peptide/nickel transport system permease protein
VIYAARRLGHTIFVLWVVATALFFMFRLIPGDPTVAYLDPTFTEQQRQQLLAEFGLDKPLSTQYWVYLDNLVHLRFGLSFRERSPALGLIMQALPNTIVLTFSSLVLAYVFGALAGAWLAWRRGSRTEAVAIPIVLASRAAPDFWLGMIMISIFAFGLEWFPAGGAASAGAVFPSFWARLVSPDYLHHLALPMLTLALFLQGLPLLLMRSNMLEIMGEEFVTMARMKGLPERSIMLRHAARNALLPLVTAFTLGFGTSVGGNVVIETVFSWPGLGRMLVDAVANSDYPVAQGAFFLIAVVLVLMNLLADLLYHWLDPRVSHGE